MTAGELGGIALEAARSPCRSCALRRSCEEKADRCRTYARWFRDWFRRAWRALRLAYGYEEAPRVWRYRAPYEGACGAREEKRYRSAALEGRLRVMDGLLEKAGGDPESLEAWRGMLGETMKELGCTQIRLGERAGVDPSAVNRICRGKLIPGRDRWSRIKDALDALWEEKDEDTD